MNDIDELKQFASVHSQLQGLPDGLWEQVLDRITTDETSDPGSWVYEWSTTAADFEAAGEPLTASHCYTMARFPFVDRPARAEALRRSVEAFDGWRRQNAGIQRFQLEPDGLDGRFRLWASGLSTHDRRPLLLFMGGIVSLKEQWASLLHLGEAVTMAVAICEMPGVGENTVRYREDSWRMLPAILDALAREADVAHTIAMANSFSGHLALRCATDDARIRGIISNAAPISDFFTDSDWLRQVPGVTMQTLAHLTQTSTATLPDVLRDWALTDAELDKVDIPVAYSGSMRDEIIPPTEIDHLRRCVRNLDIKVFDDVHASPSHLTEAREWMFGSLMRMRSGLA